MIVEHLRHEGDYLRDLIFSKPVLYLCTELHIRYGLHLVPLYDLFIKHLQCFHDESNVGLLVFDLSATLG